MAFAGIGLPFNQSAVQQAMSETPEPPPAHLLKDIVSSSYLSMVEIHKTVGEVLKGLEKGGVQTKYKGLKILLMGCAEGHMNFRLEVREVGLAVIRKCSAWEGEEDPVHGDYYNERVRQLANELMHTVLSNEGFEGTRVQEQGRITGYSGTTAPTPPPTWLNASMSYVTTGLSWATSWVSAELPAPPAPAPVPPHGLLHPELPPSLYTPPTSAPPYPKPPLKPTKTLSPPLTNPKVLSFSHPWQTRLQYLTSLCKAKHARTLSELARNPIFVALVEHQQECAQVSVRRAARRVEAAVEKLAS